MYCVASTKDNNHIHNEDTELRIAIALPSAVQDAASDALDAGRSKFISLRSHFAISRSISKLALPDEFELPRRKVGPLKDVAALVPSTLSFV